MRAIVKFLTWQTSNAAVTRSVPWRLALALQARGALPAAIRHCRRALATEPDLAEARQNLQAALATQGGQEDAQPGDITRPAP